MTAITDTTANPLFVITDRTLEAFKGVIVNDAVGVTETVIVTLATVAYSYPPITDTGSLSDPKGGGIFDPTTHTFTETALSTGDPTFGTQLLNRLIYTPPKLADGLGTAVAATVAVTDSGASPVIDPTAPIIIYTVTPPAITGTVANEPVADAPGSTIRPFATAIITDNDFNYYYNSLGTYYYSNSYGAKDTAVITISDDGMPSDKDGLLTGAGLSKTGVGTYSLPAADSPYVIQNELNSLVFTPNLAAAGRTPAFELDVTDSKATLIGKDTLTSVLLIGPGAGAPLIAGTGASTVVPGSAIKPFSRISISDPNPNGRDSVTITLTDSANGTLSGDHLVVRRETGKEEVVRVHCDEGVANHVGSEPCAGIREGVGEASVGVRAGQPLSREIVLISGADAVTRVEGNTEGRVIASVRPTRRGHRPWHVRKLLAREPGDLWIGHEPPTRGAWSAAGRR